MAVEKRYQVFVSSTFQDLQAERQEVMQALLELDCIPAGMELFPAANQDQWSLIRKVIDDCDYYIVVSAGRYGSLGPDGVGYTEMEYRYAAQRRKPILGFLHRDPSVLPAKRCEPSDPGRMRLETFRSLVQGKVVRFWDAPADLGSQVSRSLVQLIKAEPAVGWVKADSLPSEDAMRELLSLRRRVEELQIQLESARFNPPAGAAGLAQGDDKFIIQVLIRARAGNNPTTGEVTYGFSVRWNDIFSAVAPAMIDEASEAAMRRVLAAFVLSIGQEVLDGDKNIKTYVADVQFWRIAESDFQTIKVQLRALGLIEKSVKGRRSLKDTGTYWKLTPFGDATMTNLRAVKKA